MNQKIALENLTRDELSRELMEQLNLAYDDTQLLIEKLEELSDFSPDIIVSYDGFPKSIFLNQEKRITVRVKKYTINLNKIFLGALSSLIGVFPLGSLVSVFKDLIQISNAVNRLNDKELFIYETVKKMNKEGTNRVGIEVLCSEVLKSKTVDLDIKSEVDVYDVLDGLSNKNLIDIYTRSVQIL